MIGPGAFFSTQNSAAIRAPKGSPKGSSWAPKVVPGVTSEAPLEQKGQHRVHYVFACSGAPRGSIRAPKSWHKEAPAATTIADWKRGSKSDPRRLEHGSQNGPQIFDNSAKGVPEAAMLSVEASGRLRRASLESRFDPDTLPGHSQGSFWDQVRPLWDRRLDPPPHPSNPPTPHTGSSFMVPRTPSRCSRAPHSIQNRQKMFRRGGDEQQTIPASDGGSRSPLHQPCIALGSLSRPYDPQSVRR